MDTSQKNQKINKLPIFTISIGICLLWISLFKISHQIMGSYHIPTFALIIFTLIFWTILQGFIKFNQYVAEHISDNRLIIRLAESRICSYIISIFLSLILSLSAMIYVFIMDWGQIAIIITGFIVITLWLSTFSMTSLLKKRLADLGSGYLAVFAGAATMLLMQLFYSLHFQQNNFYPGSQELIDHVAEKIDHHNFIFMSLARTAAFFEESVIALNNIKELGSTLAKIFLVLTASLMPFMALSLFMRSVFERVTQLTIKYSLRKEIN